MRLDKWIAVLFLVGGMIYGYAAWNYPLLPFERNMSFLPNTFPIALAALAIILSLVILITPAPSGNGEEDVLGGIDITRLRDYKIGQASMLIGGMILYALALRPVGFLTATTLFLVVTGWILGERKLHIMIPVALIGAGAIWLLVDEVLGIFLRPFPSFLV
ncbi:tripartite tricarboxylate transporter TctB family protein [Alphaproteobacteria bacterium HT1-32]|nr:tripartite tricarboxylate transporter TctB family protein [Alphaproteobacteria bacterium HT1-32]